MLTRDKRLWALAFVAGMLPDLDGIPILFDMDLYYAIHHELFHPPIYGILLGIIAAFALYRFFRMPKLPTFFAVAAGFILHPVFDIFFTNWGVKMLWPFSDEKHLFSYFIGYNWALVLAIPLMVAAPFAKEFAMEKISKKGIAAKHTA